MPNQDLLLNDGTSAVPLMLYDDPKKGKRIHTSWDPPAGAPKMMLWHDWKNGFGYSQPGVVDDGYAYGTTTSSDYGPGIDARSPGSIVPAGAITEVDYSAITNAGAINDSFSLGSDYYLCANRILIKVLNGYSTLSSVADVGSGNGFVSAVVARYSGTSYAWLGSLTGFSKWDGTTFTTTASFNRHRLASVYWATTDGVSVQRLVATDATDLAWTAVPLTTDPMTSGNWTAASQIGEGVYGCGAVVSTGRHVYLSTYGGPYDLDDLGQTVNLAPYHIDQLSDKNGLACYYWDGSLLFGSATGVDAVDISQPGIKQGIANWAMPGASVGIPNETPIWGRPTAFTNDGGWVVMAVYNGADSFVVYGKKRVRLGFPGPGEWVWHGAVATFKNQQILHLKVRTVTIAGVPSRRLWISTVNTAGTVARLFWQSVPLTTTPRQDVVNVTAHRFGTPVVCYLTPGNSGSPGSTHSLTQGRFETRNAGTSNTAALAVSADDGAYGSTILTANESPSELDALTTLSTVTGNQITPAVTLTGTSTTPTILLSLTIWATTDPDADEVWECTVEVVREQARNSGSHPTHQNVERTYALVANMLSNVVTLTGPTGDTYTATVEGALPGDWFQVEQSQDGTRGWARTMDLRLRITDRPARYGEAFYGLGKYR